MTLLDDLRWRNLVHQTTDEEGLAAWLEEKPRTVYAGFDPTSDSLHVGNLVSLMLLRRFQQAGHRPIALVGGATGMIGDPSGKSAERNLLTPETLQQNVAALREQVSQFLDFESGDQPALLVNNLDWIGKFSYIEFLRDVGKNFPVNVMLAKDSVKGRLGRDDGGISYTEFSYMLLQAYDFVHLNQEYGCDLQVGGSDQWGNITAGTDLGRRMHAVQLRGMTTPLLLKSDGTKMGKTESGAVWLSPERTSPYQFYQYWLNVDDADVGNCLRVLTELPREEIEQLDASREESPGKKDSQRRLAESLTELVHGRASLESAMEASKKLFSGELSNLSDAELKDMFADVPSCEMPRSDLQAGIGLIDLFVAASLSESKGKARRTIEQGGAYVNNRRMDQVDAVLTEADLASETVMVLRSGKKKYALVRFA